ncbi:serine/threonine-protein kinase [Actinophytocola algeriensis]|uniref:non-specific serine/threonine protein kinase n=1 Tax=Actinophytocola algeriensis TaxID=1768010 RepID=A0A7W7Q971_9PSEU|nr:serine/threonine-protein kinase [Actinophytocola algeriensis]MBB4909198.1 hypothetical protein [Actinophytocola algeriensis]MBE1474414.1 serine/threonine protein kinase [Actinophytocola algeriensis]
MTDEGHLVAGRYRLVRRIGTGGMAVVWQGHDERLNRPVAVKKLLPHRGRPQPMKAVARCLREGRIAARLHHPNATTVFDVVDEDGVPCLVMEYLPSRSLATAIAETGTLPPGEVAAIGVQIAAALAAAHAAGIVHRDITPANILLGEDGSVKLTDFGISRSADDAAATRTGVIGTPAYLAPEVALGAEPTPASDVFSLGSTLYTALEGEPPFGKPPNTLALLHAVAGGEINPPRRSGPLTGVLTALLTADPHTRPTAQEALDLLAAAGFGAVAEPVPPPVTSTGRRPVAAVGALVVALAAAGIWLTGDRTSVIPVEERAPVTGTEHNPTTQPPANAPAGEPVRLDETPTRTRPAPKAPPPPAVDVPVTTTQPATTTENTPAPSEPVPTTTPPTSSEETTTAPGSVEPTEPPE